MKPTYPPIGAIVSAPKSTGTIVRYNDGRVVVRDAQSQLYRSVPISDVCPIVDQRIIL